MRQFKEHAKIKECTICSYEIFPTPLIGSDIQYCPICACNILNEIKNEDEVGRRRVSKAISTIESAFCTYLCLSDQDDAIEQGGDIQ